MLSKLQDKLEQKNKSETSLDSNGTTNTNNSTPETCSEFDTMVKHKELLLKGVVFLKYGSWGEPGKRLVSVTNDFQLLEWRHLDQERPSGSVSVGNLLGIKFGRTTKVFKRRPPTRAGQDQLSFTVVGDKRNLDLEAGSKEEMDQFLEGLVSLIKYLKRDQLR